MRCQIGLVEDDPIIRDNLSDFLTDRGFDVRGYTDRPSALEAFRENLPDVVLLDVGLGDEREGGFQICKELRRESPSLPVLFLTSHDAESDRISGLRLGADDYLSKESSFEFLVVRLETLMERRAALRERGVSDEIYAAQSVGSLEIDSSSSKLRWKGQPVDVSLTRYWMITELARAQCQARSPADLMKAAKIHVEPNTIASHISFIRDRFLAIDPEFDAIRTERGLGYRWVED